MNVAGFLSSVKELSGKEGTTIATDEASTRDKKKMAVSITDAEGNTFAVGLRELKTKKTEDMFSSLKEIFSDFDRRIEALRPVEGEQPKPIYSLLTEVRHTMSDRAANQKNLNQLVEDLVNEVIPRLEQSAAELEPEDERLVVKLQKFYCGIHHLVHFADVMSVAANQAELAEFDGKPPAHKSSFKNAKEATGVSLVRKVSKAVGPGADEKSGCHGKAKIYLQAALKKFDATSFPITSFRGHRFNVLGFNSEYVYCLRKELTEFF